MANMRLVRQLIYRNSLIQVYEDSRVFLDRVDVTDYAYVDGGPAERVERAKEIMDHYSRQCPTYAPSARVALPAR